MNNHQIKEQFKKKAIRFYLVNSMMAVIIVAALWLTKQWGIYQQAFVPIVVIFFLWIFNIDKVLSSEWCRCKETAKIAFKNFSTNSFLNSFYSSKFAKNKDKQVKALKEYIKKFKSDKNLVLVTHYVLISEILNYGPSSGEIVVSNRNLNIIGSLEINY